MAGTIYRSICGCISSAPAPDYMDYSTDSGTDWDSYERDREQWERQWESEVEEHIATCSRIDEGGFVR